jgi:hypothetical protein
MTSWCEAQLVLLLGYYYWFCSRFDCLSDGGVVVSVSEDGSDGGGDSSGEIGGAERDRSTAEMIRFRLRFSVCCRDRLCSLVLVAGVGDGVCSDSGIGAAGIGSSHLDVLGVDGCDVVSNDVVSNDVVSNDVDDVVGTYCMRERRLALCFHP